jgi:hypothetical protein
MDVLGANAEHTFSDAGIHELRINGNHYEVDLSPIGCARHLCRADHAILSRPSARA